jgi:hypothetical protein
MISGNVRSEEENVERQDEPGGARERERVREHGFGGSAALCPSREARDCERFVAGTASGTTWPSVGPHCPSHSPRHLFRSRQALWDFTPAESSALMWRQTKHVHCSECIDRANDKGACVNIWNPMGACVKREDAHSSFTQGQAPTLMHDAQIVSSGSRPRALFMHHALVSRLDPLLRGRSHVVAFSLHIAFTSLGVSKRKKI